MQIGKKILYTNIYNFAFYLKIYIDSKKKKKELNEFTI